MSFIVKYIANFIFAIAGVFIGIAGTFIYLQGQLVEASIEGSIGEAAAMSELLAQVATNSKNYTDLRDSVFLISCRSSGAAFFHFEENEIDSGYSFDQASNARKLQKDFGLEKCY